MSLTHAVVSFVHVLMTTFFKMGKCFEFHIFFMLVFHVMEQNIKMYLACVDYRQLIKKKQKTKKW